MKRRIGRGNKTAYATPQPIKTFVSNVKALPGDFRYLGRKIKQGFAATPSRRRMRRTPWAK